MSYRAHGAARIASGLGPDPDLPADLPETVREALLRADLPEAQAHLAWELARLCPGLSAHEHLALVAIALVTQEALSRGSTRVPRDPSWLAEQARAIGFDLPTCAAIATLMARASALATGDPPEGRVQAPVRDGSQYARRAQGDPIARIFGTASDKRPLVLDGEHLYQERLLALERRLAALLSARVERDPPEGRVQARAHDGPQFARRADGDPLAIAGLDGVIRELAARPAGSVVLTSEQEEAVRAALRSPLAVVSGGPGTGKTSIVVAILRAAIATLTPPASIALAAPTGKAADRMRRSIEAALARIDDPHERDRELRASLPRPMTLHRLLGYSPSRGGFAHHADNPLSERLVIVDESSMIDVFLMERLASSLLPSARLVLLGDAEQLPSVAAGAVFRDLGSARRVPSVVLTKSHRMDPTRPEGFNVLSVAAQINAGKVPPLVAGQSDGELLLPADTSGLGALVQLPADPGSIGGVFLYEPQSPLDRERFIDFWYEHRALGPPAIARLATETWPREDGRISARACDALETLFTHVERARLLCVTRSAARPTGVEAINASLHRRLADHRRASAALFLAGEPILVHRNDYERGLFNGDQGVVLFTAAQDEGPVPSAVFRKDEGFVAHPIEAVRASIELGYATTVHKAQGSEHDQVVLILPETDSPRLLTREIVYTAITRARRSVLVVGSPELLARAAARRVERSTGIAERMSTTDSGQ